MAKNICQTYLKGLKEFHFKLFLALALASGATRPHFRTPSEPPVLRVKNRFVWLPLPKLFF